MKKVIITIVLGITALFVTSCTTIYEKAYQAEMLYKAKKKHLNLCVVLLKNIKHTS